MVKTKLNIDEEFYQEETRCGYKITKQTKEIWAIQLDLLAEFIRVCNKNKIKFIAFGGTLLGCVRHDGYIPWDDDIDISMTRNEYDRLCKIAQKEFIKPYFFQTEESDPGCFRGHAQLRNSNTTAMLKSERYLKCEFNQGIFIDIIPQDNIPDNTFRRTVFVLNLLINQRIFNKLLILKRNINIDDNIILINKIKKTVSYVFNKIDNKLKVLKKLYNHIEKIKKKYNTKETKEVGNLFYIKSIDLKNNIGSTKYYLDKTVNKKFEMLEIPIPIDYDEYLTKQYGNYLKMIEASSFHGEILFDTKKSYKYYIENI